jgi:hypothetical protein
MSRAPECSATGPRPSFTASDSFPLAQAQTPCDSTPSRQPRVARIMQAIASPMWGDPVTFSHGLFDLNKWDGSLNMPFPSIENEATLDVRAPSRPLLPPLAPEDHG